MIAEHPLDLAAAIASLLRGDAIAARQVREHIPDQELYEILELPEKEPPDFEALSDTQLFRELQDRFTKAEILRRLK